jgi:hypothetical protein
MSYNGSGVFNINTAGQPVVTGTVISSTAFNALTADLATGLTTALTKDGQTTPTANIPMGGFKITGIAAATTLGDALSYGRAATVSTLTNSALTSGRVPYATTAGLLTDSANLLYSGTDLTVYGLTVGRGAGAVATNTVVGTSALATNTSGVSNTATGYQALNAVSTGNNNSAYGRNSLLLNTGSNNTGYGAYTLQANISGAQNAAFGQSAGYGNTTGVENSFFGQSAGYTNSTGAYNVALGSNALYSNTTASNSTAVGYQAGYTQTGSDCNANVYVGYKAGYTSSGTASLNLFAGTYAGYSNTTGTGNTYVGGGFNYGAGYYMTTGSKNTIIGSFTGNQDGLDIRTASNYAVISDGDGNRLLSTANGYSLALDGGAVPQTGTGITFPATQNASSDANTLDDYEEGAWTPNLKFGGANTGITYQSYNLPGFYYKIGGVVFFSCTQYLSNKGSATGSATISGLPFTTAQGNGGRVALSINLGGVTYVGQYSAQTDFNSTTILLNQVSSLGVPSDLDNTNFANTSTFFISGFYTTV